MKKENIALSIGAIAGGTLGTLIAGPLGTALGTGIGVATAKIIGSITGSLAEKAVAEAIEDSLDKAAEEAFEFSLDKKTGSKSISKEFYTKVASTKAVKDLGKDEVFLQASSLLESGIELEKLLPTLDLIHKNSGSDLKTFNFLSNLLANFSKEGLNSENFNLLKSNINNLELKGIEDEKRIAMSINATSLGVSKEDAESAKIDLLNSLNAQSAKLEENSFVKANTFLENSSKILGRDFRSQNSTSQEIKSQGILDIQTVSLIKDLVRSNVELNGQIKKLLASNFVNQKNKQNFESIIPTKSTVSDSKDAKLNEEQGGF